MNYKVDIDIFEGPMDLLLHLINKAEIDIYDIPINTITEQFLIYLNKIEELNLEVASEFLIMASTLIEIKSKMLLPKKPLDEQIEIDELDPRIELVQRLIKYKKYKKASKELRAKEIIQKKVYYKPKEDIFETDIEIIVEDMEISMLLKAVNNILESREKKEKLLSINEIQREEYTLEDCIKSIKDQIIIQKSIKFTEILSDDSNVEEIITFFISILELVRLEFISVKQVDDFTDIIIIKRKDNDT